jgi:site-specific DNA-cytosine methylase
MMIFLEICLKRETMNLRGRVYQTLVVMPWLKPILTFMVYVKQLTKLSLSMKRLSSNWMMALISLCQKNHLHPEAHYLQRLWISIRECLLVRSQ